MAIPFAWVESEQVARELIIAYTATNHKGEHFIRPEWGEHDIHKAVSACRQKFRLAE